MEIQIQKEKKIQWQSHYPEVFDSFPLGGSPFLLPLVTLDFL